ncbi:MAG: hypothetical protein HGA45_16265 [Chloroflexales bacterium]|nr:hypothetical protein [Chloroflexales bacterium]
MSTEQANRAVEHMFAFATAGAGASFSIKTFVPLPVVDAVPQTLIVKGMSDQLASIYGYNKLKGLTVFTGVLVAAGSGVKLASEVITFVPFAGPSTSAVTAFGLHMLTGVALIITFELLQKGAIAEDYIKTTSVDEIAHLLGLASRALLNILRGDDRAEAISVAVDTFSLKMA